MEKNEFAEVESLVLEKNKKNILIPYEIVANM